MARTPAPAPPLPLPPPLQHQVPGLYVPQVGDEVVYLWRGHAALFEALNDKATARPWTELRGIRNAEPCVVGGRGSVCSTAWLLCWRQDASWWALCAATA